MGGSVKATVTVEDAEGNAIATAPANGEITAPNGTATFTMPAGAVTVTATFA